MKNRFKLFALSLLFIAKPTAGPGSFGFRRLSSMGQAIDVGFRRLSMSQTIASNVSSAIITSIQNALIGIGEVFSVTEVVAWAAPSFAPCVAGIFATLPAWCNSCWCILGGVAGCYFCDGKKCILACPSLCKRFIICANHSSERLTGSPKVLGCFTIATIPEIFALIGTYCAAKFWIKCYWPGFAPYLITGISFNDYFALFGVYMAIYNVTVVATQREKLSKEKFWVRMDFFAALAFMKFFFFLFIRLTPLVDSMAQKFCLILPAHLCWVTSKTALISHYGTMPIESDPTPDQPIAVRAYNEFTQHGERIYRAAFFLAVIYWLNDVVGWAGSVAVAKMINIDPIAVVPSVQVQVGLVNRSVIMLANTVLYAGFFFLADCFISPLSVRVRDVSLKLGFFTFKFLFGVSQEWLHGSMWAVFLGIILSNADLVFLVAWLYGSFTDLLKQTKLRAREIPNALHFNHSHLDAHSNTLSPSSSSSSPMASPSVLGKSANLENPA